MFTLSLLKITLLLILNHTNLNVLNRQVLSCKDSSRNLGDSCCCRYFFLCLLWYFISRAFPWYTRWWRARRSEHTSRCSSTSRKKFASCSPLHLCVILRTRCGVLCVKFTALVAYVVAFSTMPRRAAVTRKKTVVSSKKLTNRRRNNEFTRSSSICRCFRPTRCRSHSTN